ncbi:MAG: glycosyltransferase [Verrucomicrobia bacterium]|nr:glycosyltransferase [Verrucomicrobiota bacterium]
MLNREFRPDAIVLSVTHYATGLPRLPTGVPVILDHVDECPTWVGEKYFRIADGISAVSNALYQSAAAVHPCVELIPNGVELGGYSSGHRESAKAALGLTGRVVVSLIGLTCSSRLYFLEAYADFAREVPDAVLLLVGDSQLAGAMKERIGHLGVDIRMTGHLSFDQVATYFNATDIGLYPGDDVPYFRQAYPLKIMEYTASGAQVVISPVDAFRSGWANVWTSQPDRDGFRNTMLEAWRNPRPAKDVSGMGWQDAAGRFEGLLEQVVARKEKRAS